MRKVHVKLTVDVLVHAEDGEINLCQRLQSGSLAYEECPLDEFGDIISMDITDAVVTDSR